ncbi:MAG: methyltransferase domain-containing protein [Gammaproteobacteria bacterium]|jgi:arsenite methyltransferase
MNVESAVTRRYAEGAQRRQESLCCPVDYDASLLQLLPQEIVEKDYGCGDPSAYVREGDVVLDLGSGGGKICYMAAQLVGEAGRVIGVDMTDAMLALARKYQADMAQKLGGDRVRFLKGYIQDLALDVEAMEAWLAQHPVSDAASLAALEQWRQEQRRHRPLIPDASVDLVISNCVLNLVGDGHKRQLVEEIHRVTRAGGRVAISDIVSDEVVPERLKDDEALWSGCIAGAFQEQEMIDAFLDAGFQAVAYDKWSAEPWQVVDGIEFRAVTLTAVKPQGRECLDRGHAVIYRGPYSFIRDDDGHEFPRGERMAVCERTFRFLTQGPYREDFIGITPAVEREAVAWCAPPGTRRAAADTKGGEHSGGGAGGGCC